MCCSSRCSSCWKPGCRLSRPSTPFAPSLSPSAQSSRQCVRCGSSSRGAGVMPLQPPAGPLERPRRRPHASFLTNAAALCAVSSASGRLASWRNCGSRFCRRPCRRSTRFSAAESPAPPSPRLVPQVATADPLPPLVVPEAPAHPDIGTAPGRRPGGQWQDAVLHHAGHAYGAAQGPRRP